MKYRTITIAVFFLIIYSCAVQSPPTGGLADNEGPYVKIINPKNGTINITPNQSIEVLFNEMIDPKTVKSSIKVFPEVDVKINISRKKIIIRPNNEWPAGTFRINISRAISDFHGNKLKSSMDLLFSSLSAIPIGKISGEIFNFDHLNPSKICLFKIENGLRLVAITENNYLNEFSFSYISNGDYVIVGIEGDIENIYNDIKIYNYGVSNNKITVENNYISGVKLNYSYPIYRKNIKSIEFKNDSFGIVKLDDGSIIDIINKKYFDSNMTYNNDISFFESNQISDSVLINIKLKNNIESYSINKYIYFNQNILDTISPLIKTHEKINDKMLVEFSEPIIIDEGLEIFSTINSDSSYSNLDYEINGPMSINLINLSKDMNLITINNILIKDYANNSLADSLLVLELNNNGVYSKPRGNIFGKIIYEGKNKIIVEAINTMGEKFKAKINKYNEFSFLDLEVDEFTIWAYEDLNTLSDNYFNGTLEPINYSAKFNYYNEVIQTKANWDIEDVRIRID